MILKTLGLLEDAFLTFAVAFFFLALALGSLGEDAGWAWAAMWGCVGGLFIAGGYLLRYGPGVLAKIIRERAAAIARQSEVKP